LKEKQKMGEFSLGKNGISLRLKVKGVFLGKIGYFSS
jgi:hypothetical protein